MWQAYNYGDHAFTTGVCYRSFLGKRYARMLPLYYVSQLICLGRLVERMKASPVDAWAVLHYIALALGANTWFPWPMTATDGITRGVFMGNATLWSLQTELAFYVAFPLLLRAVRWLLGVSTVSGLGRGQSVDVDRRCRYLLGLLGMFVVLSMVPILVQCYGPSASATAAIGRELRCYGDWLGLIYAWPVCRVSEFILGILTASLYVLGCEAQSAGPDASHTALVRFVSSHWLLHSPLVLMAWTSILALLMIFLPHPDVGLPSIVFSLNPGSFALGFVFLLLLLVQSHSPLKPAQRQPNPVAALLTLPVALTMGELSFAFYAFHEAPLFYLSSIGEQFPRSAALAFVAALGLAIPGHHLVEVPVYQWVGRRLRRCDCHDDHVGLSDIHRDEAVGQTDQEESSVEAGA